MGNPGQSRGKGWQRASRRRGRPEDSLVLGLETSASLSLGGGRRGAGIPGQQPQGVDLWWVSGTTGCGHFCPFPSHPFLAARAGHGLGHLPFLTAPLPVSSLPTEAPGSEGLRPSPVGRASQAPPGRGSGEEGMQGWEGLCALLLPSCRDAGHTLASEECTSGAAAALRHRAEQAEA